MEKFTVRAQSGKTEVIIGDSHRNLASYCSKADTVIITDSNVSKLYGKAFDGYKTIVIGSGEKNKNLDTINYIYEKLFTFNADRSSFIVGAGGGVVTDIAGFAASTYMRGIPYGFVSTTLLGQVDASIGGKNGVNFHDAKNLIGTFTQPEFVIIDTETLATLTRDEKLSGIGEIVKHSLIAGGEFFEKAFRNVTPELCDPASAPEKSAGNLISYFIGQSIRIKAEIVGKDERESGLRRILNLGHTLAHAIEIGESLPHGVAVIKGMKFAADFSMKEGILDRKENGRITALLENTGVDLRIRYDREKIKKLVVHDKKMESGEIYFVFIEKAGKVTARRIPAGKLMEAIDDLCVHR